MATAIKKSVGIRELKDQASELVQYVQKTRRSVLITNKDKEVAKLVPLESDLLSRLEDLGLLARRSEQKTNFKSLELLSLSSEAKKAMDVDTALETFREERDGI
jgi:prevent-host-death family protein